MEMRFANEHGYCELNSFPGCSQIVVSNHGVIFPEHRGAGHGHENHRLRVERATALGYNLMLCTVNQRNTAEKAVLQKRGWKYLHTFENTETGNFLELWCLDLKRKKKG